VERWIGPRHELVPGGLEGRDGLACSSVVWAGTIRAVRGASRLEANGFAVSGWCGERGYPAQRPRARRGLPSHCAKDSRGAVWDCSQDDDS